MNNITSEFFKIIKVDSKHTRGYSGSWYLTIIKPLPDNQEIKDIISDLFLGKTVCVNIDGGIEHYNRCDNYSHYLPKKVHIAIDKILSNIEDTSFKIAIRDPYYEYKTGSMVPVLQGQPLVFCIEPTINFESFPNQPHINGYTQEKIPASLCYTNDYSNFKGKSIDEMIKYAIDQSSIWLFKHQLWVELEKIGFLESWIGPEAERLDNFKKITLINPNSRCLCGSEKPFKDCCLNTYFMKQNKKPIDARELTNLQERWDKHNNFEKDFRALFLDLFDRYKV